MKKILITLFVSIMLISSVGAINVYVDGKELVTKVPAQIIDGRTMVPIAPIFDALGATVSWDAATRTATGIKDDIKIEIKIGSNIAYVNGIPVTLDVPAKIVGGRTMVPVRFVSQSLGAKVHWDGKTSTVRIVTKLYNVLRVVDGDTIVIDFNGAEETVRLIGVDTPESVHPIASKNTEAGIAASKFTKYYLSNQAVELEFDVQERDKYGRLLAYVYTKEGMFNEKLLQTGYASISTYPPNVKYVDQFTEIVKNRDSSIPTGNYLNGYMEAPSIIYRTSSDTNKMDQTLLFITGKIEYFDETEDGTKYCIINTKDGYATVVNYYNDDNFKKLKIGDTVSLGMIYTTTDVNSNMIGGAYTLTLQVKNNVNENTSIGTEQSTNRTVYITKTGKKYHFNGNCNGGTYYKSTLSEAKSRGLTPCSKCAK